MVSLLHIHWLTTLLCKKFLVRITNFVHLSIRSEFDWTFFYRHGINLQRHYKKYFRTKLDFIQPVWFGIFNWLSLLYQFIAKYFVFGDKWENKFQNCFILVGQNYCIWIHSVAVIEKKYSIDLLCWFALLFALLYREESIKIATASTIVKVFTLFSLFIIIISVETSSAIECWSSQQWLQGAGVHF